MDTREIVTRLAEDLGRDEQDARRILATITAELGAELLRHHSITVPGLGTFDTAERPAHRWFNPRLRRFLLLPRHLAIVFRPARVLKQALWKRHA